LFLQLSGNAQDVNPHPDVGICWELEMDCVICFDNLSISRSFQKADYIRDVNNPGGFTGSFGLLGHFPFWDPGDSPEFNIREVRIGFGDSLGASFNDDILPVKMDPPFLTRAASDSEILKVDLLTD
jgi:hypothetical protein